jgi:steroid delta-isomerase-like uncharacterized protein
MPAKENLACQWFEHVWNRNDLSAIKAFTTPDLKAHGADGIVRTQESFADFQRSIKSALPDLKVEVKHCVEGRDMVAVHWVASGTHTGKSDGLPDPNGGRVELSGLTLVRMAGDKIAEGWDDYDAADLMRQLGATV